MDRMRRAVAAARDRGSVSSPRPRSRAVATLSGGNQQKVALAGTMATRPRLLAVEEPTRGVDIGTKANLPDAPGLRPRRQRRGDVLHRGERGVRRRRRRLRHEPRASVGEHRRACRRQPSRSSRQRRARPGGNSAARRRASTTGPSRARRSRHDDRSHAERVGGSDGCEGQRRGTCRASPARRRAPAAGRRAESREAAAWLATRRLSGLVAAIVVTMVLFYALNRYFISTGNLLNLDPLRRRPRHHRVRRDAGAADGEVDSLGRRDLRLRRDGRRAADGGRHTCADGHPRGPRRRRHGRRRQRPHHHEGRCQLVHHHARHPQLRDGPDLPHQPQHVQQSLIRPGRVRHLPVVRRCQRARHGHPHPDRVAGGRRRDDVDPGPSLAVRFQAGRHRRQPGRCEGRARAHRPLQGDRVRHLRRVRRAGRDRSTSRSSGPPTPPAARSSCRSPCSRPSSSAGPSLSGGRGTVVGTLSARCS